MVAAALDGTTVIRGEGGFVTDRESPPLFFLAGAPFGFVEQGEDVGGLIQGFHDGLVSEDEEVPELQRDSFPWIVVE